mgnify:CR=1 FL=1
MDGQEVVLKGGIEPISSTKQATIILKSPAPHFLAFGFSEEEIEKATDFDFVKPIRDAVMGAIDWVRDLFRFDGKGVDFSKLAKFIDILFTGKSFTLLVYCAYKF